MNPDFFALVDQLNIADPADRHGVERAIWSKFGVEMAVLALDMSHFSLTVRRSGILGYLGLIRRMHVLSEPIVQQANGTVVKYCADNLMAVFPDVPDAVAAAVAINLMLAEKAAEGAPEITVGVGIDYGRFLMIPGEDCYGDPVNISYKLGEDLARPGEVLITSAARERLPAGLPYALQEQPASVSGLELASFSIEYDGKR